MRNINGSDNGSDFTRVSSPDRPPKVRLLAIGEDRAVIAMMSDLHQRGFAELATWSLPLHFDDSSLQLHLESHEIIRFHNWRQQWRG